jgi:hypothetical protein
MLHPIEGAVEGQAEFGRAHFKLDGHNYLLFSATPITGGDQPRAIWVYRNPQRRLGGSGHGPPEPLITGASKVSILLKDLAP